MERLQGGKKFKLGTPANYRIRVQGNLDRSWSDRLEGMTILPDLAEPSFVTVLQGYVVDQAALSGILNTLYELHLPLLSVENMDEGRKKGLPDVQVKPAPPDTNESTSRI